MSAFLVENIWQAPELKGGGLAETLSLCFANCSKLHQPSSMHLTYLPYSLDLHYVCLSSAYQNMVMQCLQSNCTSTKWTQVSLFMTHECVFGI